MMNSTEICDKIKLDLSSLFLLAFERGFGTKFRFSYRKINKTTNIVCDVTLSIQLSILMGFIFICGSQLVLLIL